MSNEVSVVTASGEPEWAAFVAIDWADKKHYWKLVVAGSQKQEQGELENTPEAVGAWVADLNVRFGGRPIAVCLEQSRGSLVYMLLKFPQLVLFPVHPKMAADMRRAFHPSGTKGDPSDTAPASGASHPVASPLASRCSRSSRLPPPLSPASISRGGWSVEMGFIPSSTIWRARAGPDGRSSTIPEAGKTMAAARRDEHDRIVRKGKWREAVRAYLAAISFADAMVGRILASLASSAYANNTIIVFWSDNGWHLGEKRHWHKSTLWQRSTHVPMIIAGPGVREPGKDRSQPVSLLDLYPTLVEMCGLPHRSQLEGTSLVPLLRNPNARRNPTVSTYLPGNHAVTDEKFRYIRYADGSEELYDSVNDPNEFHNLAAQPKYERQKKELARWAPQKSAESKPDRTAYDFDFPSYTWKLK